MRVIKVSVVSNYILARSVYNGHWNWNASA